MISGIRHVIEGFEDTRKGIEHCIASGKDSGEL